jgi:hypothetical protein
LERSIPQQFCHGANIRTHLLKAQLDFLERAQQSGSSTVR